MNGTTELGTLLASAANESNRAMSDLARAMRSINVTFQADTSAYRLAVHRVRSRLGQLAVRSRRLTRRQKRRARKARRR